MWPGYNPYTPDPVVCCAWPVERATLLLTEYLGAYAASARVEVQPFATYSFTHEPEPTASLAEAAATTLGPRVRRLGYEPHALPLAVRAAIERRIEVTEWVDVEPVLEVARLIKTDDEISAIRRACAAADTMQAVVKEQALPGRTELEVAGAALQSSWELVGARHAALLQIASGPVTAALPSGEPSRRAIKRGDVVCLDVAPWVEGYWSDTCNGVVVGEPTARAREVFDILQTALEAGITAARPGAVCAQVDHACRSVVQAAGHDYPHHTGHGIGTAHTERPRITPDSTERLEPGMVVCLEPGIYIEGWGGFRHEHAVLVTDDAAEILTTFPHTL
jgi:Xaa-Pro aminopeptidase